MNESSDRCDQEVFQKGTPLLAANTWYPEDNPCRATGFEKWVKAIAKASGQKVDWHYSGGIAQVLYIGDRQKILDAMKDNYCPAQILRMFGVEDQGLYRSDVTPVPERTLGAFYDGGPGSTFIGDDS